jgi:hypothetical protein
VFARCVNLKRLNGITYISHSHAPCLKVQSQSIN